MNPIHQPDDPEKVIAIAERMERDGWVGAPLVRWDDNLLTGAHRYAAAHRVLGWPDNEIPTVDIRDVFAAEGLDFDALCITEGVDGIDSPDLEYLLNHYLTEDVREQYGIDLR